ncbi:NUDIX domain-containing protein [Opitutaceae bacterium TAV4]|nr:NUDIX domain-containing protein [Opitutaceae bacterium TAV4]RRJ97291.1 NUDIX domain-containing protein [Opitutaceae bacterium TAV4]RRJ99394.1 NUDIX domain-containing protein [Opitutaceae bacterium TAV3]
MSTTRPPATSAATTPSVPVHAQRLDELFDVVDENDRVLRQETRAEVHRQKLLHRSIHVLVFDRAGRVFLQKRSLAKDTAPGCWASSCSGHVDAGEDYDQAVVRELAEEIGITVTAPPPRWHRAGPCRETGWEFVWVYRLEHEGPFVLHPAEIDDGRWFTREELAAEIAERPRSFALSFLYLWQQLETELGR